MGVGVTLAQSVVGVLMRAKRPGVAVFILLSRTVYILLSVGKLVCAAQAGVCYTPAHAYKRVCMFARPPFLLFSSLSFIAILDWD